MQRPILSLALLLAVALLAWFVGTVFAHDKGVYLPEDSRRQLSPTISYNYAPKQWVLRSATNSANAVRYFSADSDLLSLARTAISRWKTEFPALPWLEVSSTSTADVLFVWGNCDDHLGTLEYINLEADSVRKTIYWTDVEICLSNTYAFAHDADKVEILVHEIGHAYGLHDRYVHPGGGCNNGDVSIMDGENCDSGSIETNDTTRVRKFYQEGILSDFTESSISTTSTQVGWLDSAWAEKRQAYWTAYRLSPNHDWVSYGYMEESDWVGMHKDMARWFNYRRTEVVDLTVHTQDNTGVVLPDVSEYVLCGRAVSAQYGDGRVTCSDYIEVSNAAHNAAIPTPTPTPIPDPHLTVEVTNRNPVRGETVTLTAVLDPHPPGTVTYQWQRPSNDQWSDISGADSAKLRVRSDSRVTRSYQVKVSYDLNGPVVATSSTVTIRWRNAPTSTPTPTATNTPTPTATNTPTPTATNTPTPTATNTPEPPTATPTPAQSWCELYPDLCCDDEPWHPFCGAYK